MSVLKLLSKLLVAAAKAGHVVEKVEQVVQRITARPPAPRSQPPLQAALDMPSASPIYKDEHCWSRDAATEPPVYCYYCKQLRVRASRFCPGMPPKELD